MFRSSNRQRPMAARQTLLGFTLIELMIVLALLAILAALAWPSYVESVQKSRRSAAIAAIAKVMQAQERARSNQPSYTNNINQLNGAPTVSEGGHYALSIAANSATTTGYTVVATAATSQAGDRNCAKMLAVVLNGNISYQSVDSAGVAATGPSPCWAQ